MSDCYVLLDARGLVMHQLHSGMDHEATRDSLTHRPVNTPNHALANLITDVILPLLKDFRVKQIVAVWDGGNHYRESLSGGTYKAKRKARETSPELKEAVDLSIKAAQEFFRRLGITQVRVPTVEADDVIAWMVDRLPANVVIHTVDRDLLQLAAPRPDKHVAVKIRRDWPETFVDKDVSVPFRWVALYKSLVGDTSDEYAGVKGFGPKAWVQLVETYGYDNLHELEHAVDTGDFVELWGVVNAEPGQHPLLEKLLGALSEWCLSWQLAKLHPELVNSKHEPERKFLRPQWSARVPNSEKLYHLLNVMGCADLWQDLAPYMPNQTLITAEGTTEEELLADAKFLIDQSPFIALDWETWAPTHEPFIQASKGREYVDMLSSRLTGVGLTMGRNLEHTFYLSVGHKDTPNLSPDLIPKLLALIPDDKPIVIQNMSFELSVYKAQFGLELPNCHDTKVMACHVNEHDSNGLKDLSLKLLGYKQTHYRDVIEKGKTMADYSAQHVFQYGADDPLVTAHLYELLKLQLMLEGTWEFVRDNEFPAIYPLVDAYLDGVEIDWETLEAIRAEDEKIYRDNMYRLRQLLRENNTPEAITAGTENLFAFEREVLDATLAEGSITQEEYAESLAKLRLGLEARVTYADWTCVDKPLDVKITPSWLRKAAMALDLPTLPPDVKTLTKKAWNDWVDAVLEVKTDDPWIARLQDCLRDCRETYKDSATPEGKALLRHLELIFRIHWPDTKTKEWTGTELSLSSPKQMQALLYGMIGLPARLRAFDPSERRSELKLDGAVQANEDAIKTAMAWDAPEGTWQREALECLLQAKKADTRRKTFYETYPLWAHPATGRVHAQVNSVGTGTRRMSGSSPNLMQMPKRGDGVKFRKCVIPHKGHDLIISIDFAGEELRVGAGLSQDPDMLGCYIDSKILSGLSKSSISLLRREVLERLANSELMDLHSATAAQIAGLPYEVFEANRHSDDKELSGPAKACRNIAKTVNFGAQYGIGPAKLSRQLICSLEQAKDYLSAKKSAFPVFEQWRADSIAELHRTGYLRTLYGSYRHVFDDLFTTDEGLLGYYERAAVNFLIQGMCADYLKVVLRSIKTQNILPRHGAKLIAPIHDELVFSCSSTKAAAFICEVHTTMVQGIPGLPCPIWAEPSLGPNFAEQIEIGPWPTPELVESAIDKALDRRKAA